MKKLMLLAALILLISGNSFAITKYESGNYDAQSSVLYGKQADGTVTAIKVDSSGNVFTSGGGISSTSSYIDADQVFNVKNTTYGAKGDGVHKTDGAITNGTANFTSASGIFSPSDVGKVICIIGAGTSAADLTTTISAYVSSTAVTLTDTAATTVSGTANYTYGTDDTTSIQSAINAAGVAGGGTVFFPVGIYLVNGNFQNPTHENAQLTLPSIDIASNSQQIKIKGAFFQQLVYTGLSNDYGSIIYFTKSGIAGTNGLAAWGPTTVGGQNFSNILTEIENLKIRTLTNPQNTAINLGLSNTAVVEGLNIEAGYVKTSSPPLEPTGTTDYLTGNYALVTPYTSNHVQASFDRIQIIGFFNGIEMFEHSTLNNSGIYFCENAVVIPGDPHIKLLGYVSLESNKYNLTFIANSFSGSTSSARINTYGLDLEHAASGWYQTTADINDPLNLGVGDIHWSGSGSAQTILYTGGAGLQSFKWGNNFAISSSGNVGIGTTLLVDKFNIASSSSTVRSTIKNNTSTGFIESRQQVTTLFNVGIGGSNIGGAYLAVSTNHPLTFYTNNLPRLTVPSGGNLGIGTITAASSLSINGNVSIGNVGNLQTSASSNGLYVQGNVGIGSLTPGQALDINGSGRMSQIFVSGIGTDATKTDATVCEDTTTHQFYSGSGTLGICLGTSSARYKHDINPLEEGLGSVLKLKPVNFFYNNGYGDNGAREQYGLLAEDLVNTIPRLVTFDKDKRPNSVDLLGIVPILIKAIQEQQIEIIILAALLLAAVLFFMLRRINKP